jgi:hypothetical protein
VAPVEDNMPIHSKDVPPHPAKPCPEFEVPVSPDSKVRKAVGADATKRFSEAATQIRNSIGHPITALQESAPYQEMAEAWTAWGGGDENWVAFCGKNRRLVNKIRRHLDLAPIPPKPRKAAKARQGIKSVAKR